MLHCSVIKHMLSMCRLFPVGGGLNFKIFKSSRENVKMQNSNAVFTLKLRTVVWYVIVQGKLGI